MLKVQLRINKINRKIKGKTWTLLRVQIPIQHSCSQISLHTSSMAWGANPISDFAILVLLYKKISLYYT